MIILTEFWFNPTRIKYIIATFIIVSSGFLEIRHAAGRDADVTLCVSVTHCHNIAGHGMFSNLKVALRPSGVLLVNRSRVGRTCR